MELGPDVVGPNNFFSLIQKEIRFVHPGNNFPLLTFMFVDVLDTGDYLESVEFCRSVLKLDGICLVVAHVFVDEMILTFIMVNPSS